MRLRGIKNIGNRIYKKLKYEWPVVLSLLILSAFALSNRISIFNYEFIVINMPHKLLSLFSIFRASGRLFWPVYYLIFISSIYYSVMIFKRNASKYIFLILIILVQAIDLSPRIINIRSSFINKPYYAYSQKREWDELIQGKKHFVFVDGISTNFERVAPIATSIDASLSTANIARGDYTSISNYSKARLDLIMFGNTMEDEIYLAQDKGICIDLMEDPRLTNNPKIDNIDGFCVVDGKKVGREALP